MRDRNKQLAVKQEATPGTVETLALADVLCRIRDPDTIEPDHERIDTEEVSPYSSHRPDLIGRKLLALPVSYILRGSADLTAAVAISPLLESALFKESKVDEIAYTGGSGTFLDGETVTGGTSGATGRVFRDSSSSPLRFVSISGTFQDAETITGEDSGASATSSGAPTDGGWIWEPTDSDFEAGSSKHHVSARLFKSGFYWEGRGMLSNLVLNFRNGHPVIVNQRLLGAFNAHGDASPFDVEDYPGDSVTPPRFLNTSLKLGAYSPRDIIEATLTVETAPEVREDANDDSADGVLFADYLKDAPILRLEPAMVLKATKDFFGDLQDGTTFAVEWQLTGAAAGSNWTFYADEAQLVSVGAGGRRGLAVAPLEIKLCGKKNNELVIWQH